MAEITAAMVKELRQKTGLSMGECKKALVESGGDIEKAIDILRKKGLEAAAKKAGRTTAEGMVYAYIHPGSKLGVLVEVNCETDFVARNEQFQEMVKQIAIHIATAAPRFVSKDEVTPEVLEKEKEIYLEQAMAQGKPKNIAEKIVEGKLSKFYEENCLLEQPFFYDESVTVGQFLSQKIAEIGENMKIRRFARFEVGK